MLLTRWTGGRCYARCAPTSPSLSAGHAGPTRHLLTSVSASTGWLLMASQAGVQQGDPLGPLFFSLAVHSVLEELATDRALDLKAFYLDDGFLAGPAAAVASALATLQLRCPALGLNLNLGKCELVIPCGRAPENLATLFPAPLLTDAETGACRLVLDRGFKLLGAPIGDKTFCEAFTQRRASKTKPTLEALADLHPQVGLLLLRYCASFGKLVYSARTAPPDLLSEAFGGFDADQRRALSDLLAADLTDSQWQQAARGLSFAGLGLRRLEAHAPGAYLASLASTRYLCAQLDEAYTWVPEDANTREGRALLAFNALLPPTSAVRPEELDGAPQKLQKQLSAAVDGHQHDTSWLAWG